MKNIALALFVGVLALASIPVNAQILVTNEDQNTVSVVDPTTATEFATITVGGGPSSITVSPNHTRAYTSNTNDGTVSVIDLTTYTVVTNIKVGNDPNSIAITPDGTQVYVTNSDDGTVSVINTATNMVTTTIVLLTTAPDLFTPTPQAVAITPDGTRAYVTNEDGVNMYFINTTTNLPTAFNIGIQSSGLAFTPNGDKLYVGGHLSVNTAMGRIQVVNTPANTLGVLITGGSTPHRLAITPNGARAYVTNEDEGSVSVIDTGTDTVVTTITGFSEPEGVLVDPTGTRLYVTDTGDQAKDGDPRNGHGPNTLVVLDTQSNLPLLSGTMGDDPEGIAIVGSFPSAIYQLRYLSNLNVGDSYINLTNPGTVNGSDPAGRICVNVYTFDPAEEMISCCACPVTPNGLNSLSARNDLISNTLTPGVPTSVTVKLLSSLPLAGNTCNPSSPSLLNLVGSLRAWATTLHLNTAILPAPGVYQATETPFTNVGLSISELSKLTQFCGFIQSNGSGFGICKSCRIGALGAAAK